MACFSKELSDKDDSYQTCTISRKEAFLLILTTYLLRPYKYNLGTFIDFSLILEIYSL